MNVLLDLEWQIIIMTNIFKKGICCLLLLSSFSFASAALTDNIISYWKFDESSGNAADSAGSNTLTNTSVSYVAGKINNAGSYTGSESFGVADNGTLRPANTLTISAWINFDSGAEAGGPIFVAKGTNAGDSQSWDLRLHSTKKIYYQGRVGGGSYIAGLTSTVMSPNTWYHVVFTRNGTVTHVYLNGVDETLTGVTSNAADFDYSTGNLSVGQFGSGFNFWKGKIDEVALWSRDLSSTEVTTLYNSGTGLQYPFGAVSTPPTMGFFRYFKIR